MRKYGLNLQLEKLHRSKEDEIFGAFSAPCIADISESEREKYLPEGERQNIGEEKMDCASRGPVNILETKFNWLVRNKKLSLENEKWLRENGYIVIREGKESVEFSDAFIAIKSGTTRDGNSLKAPLQAIHEFGLIPKSMLSQGGTFEEHHDPERITEKMKELGEEFVRRFPIRYQVVYEIHFGELYKEDMLDLAGYAWPEPVNGEYPKINMPPNHCFLGIKNPKHIVFDNYIDSSDGDFIKKLASDYDLLDYGYRLYIAENKFPLKKNWLLDIVKKIFVVWFKK